MVLLPHRHLRRLQPDEDESADGRSRPVLRLDRAGHEPDVDIEIRFTGLRPGEKLFEELALEGESHMPTYHQKIRIFCGSRNEAAPMDVWIAALELLVKRGADSEIIAHLKALVPEYQPMGQWKSAVGGQARAVTVIE